MCFWIPKGQFCIFKINFLILSSFFNFFPPSDFWSCHTILQSLHISDIGPLPVIYAANNFSSLSILSECVYGVFVMLSIKKKL